MKALDKTRILAPSDYFYHFSFSRYGRLKSKFLCERYSHCIFSSCSIELTKTRNTWSLTAVHCHKEDCWLDTLMTTWSSFIITKDDILVIRVFQSWISAAHSQPKHSEEESTCDFQLLESFGARIVRPSGKFCINLCFKIIQRTILECICVYYTRIHSRIVHTV